MKRTDLIRKVEAEGCVLVRNGGKHDYSIFTSGAYSATAPNGVSQPVPRHREIKEFLALHILKKLKT